MMNDDRKDTVSTSRIRHLGAVGLVVTVGLAASSGAASAPAPGSRQATDSAQASSKIAFIRLSGSAPAEIYVMNVDGSGQRLLTRSTSHLYGWSPDGRKIAFGRGRDGNDDIHVMNADGSGQRNLTRTRNELNQGAVWSPDGRKFAFTRLSESTPAPEIYVMNADGSGQRRLTRSTTTDIFPTWSPDGRKIAFDGGGPIHVMNADGSGNRLLTRNGGGVVNQHGAGGGVWSPDGRKIAFTGGDRNGWTSTSTS